MRFRDVKLLRIVESPYPDDPYPWTCTSADKSNRLEDNPVSVVGKLRPWDEDDDEYILYADGDIMIGRLEDREETP